MVFAHWLSGRSSIYPALFCLSFALWGAFCSHAGLPDPAVFTGLNAHSAKLKHNTTRLWKNVCNFLCSFSASTATSQLAHVTDSLLFVFLCGSKLQAVVLRGGERVKEGVRAQKKASLQLRCLVSGF